MEGYLDTGAELVNLAHVVSIEYGELPPSGRLFVHVLMDVPLYTLDEDGTGSTSLFRVSLYGENARRLLNRIKPLDERWWTAAARAESAAARLVEQARREEGER